MLKHYAHSREGLAKEEWHLLQSHLAEVAARAARSSSKWKSPGYGNLAGLWHDLGKYAVDWQEFLVRAGEDASTLGEEQGESLPKGRMRGPDHSSAGAIHALNCFGREIRGLPLQFAIAGHHAGLADRGDLQIRLQSDDKKRRYDLAIDQAISSILSPNVQLELPPFISEPTDPMARTRCFEFFTRMVFSALVDADFLDTEDFMTGGAALPGRPADVRNCWQPLAEYDRCLTQFLGRLRSGGPSTPVNACRAAVLDWCLHAATRPRGAYSLTVPTGGGKTLSSLAFATKHAVEWKLDRVVVALPFISILDQTADVFRQVFESDLGAPALVEHHSNIQPKFDTMANRLAAENWDAPLVVTTQVQLFESLFANRPGRCRKLHNLANSVIVLDEVQTLPVGLLAPILEVLQELVSNYGASLLLTTATQPSLESRQLGAKPFFGLSPMPEEIVPSENIDGLFQTMERVTVHWPASPDPVSWESLASEVVENRQVLVVVHKRADAVDLYRATDALVAGSVLHLSALMCPAHRRQVLADIRRRLDEGEVCRVVSTQLVEAGVDVDFPVVFRAMAGLESLAQAAGRCNREGKLQHGDFFVFHAPTEPPSSLAGHRDIASLMLAIDPDLDLTSPATFRSYFNRLYSERDRDRRGIQPLRNELKFKSTSLKFRMIDDSGITVFIPFGREGQRAVDALRFAGPSRERFRALQQFGVSVYPQALRELESRGAVEVLHDSVYVLVSSIDYDPVLGLSIAPPPPDALFV